MERKGNLQADSTSVLRLTIEAKNEHGITHVNAGDTDYENTKMNGAAQPEQLIEAVFISVGCSLTFHSMQPYTATSDTQLIHTFNLDKMWKLCLHFPVLSLPPARKATKLFPFLLFVNFCQLAKFTSVRVCKDTPEV